MDANNGIFIVIEGTDGSGKGTQFKLLSDHLYRLGYDIATFDFPQYDQSSSYFVKEYLNGAYGQDVGPYTASLFYALDRYEAAPKIREALAQGKIVLANRFTGSNMGHQGTKFDHAEERRGYFIWLDNLEYEMLKIPRPDLSLVLRVPAETAQKLVDQKEARSYTDKKRDLHEADLTHLEKAVAVYDDLCSLFPKDFQRVDCVRNDELLDIDTIQDIIRHKIEPMLPPAPAQRQKSAQVAVNRKAEAVTKKNLNPYLTKNSGRLHITDEGKKYLDDVVTTTEGNVYAFTDKLSPTTIAAAMSRFSRRAGDMRGTILDEFAHKLGQDEKLLQRAIAGYGDDSVQQLTGIHVVVEGASQILTKKLEWGRLATYLEQSTHYVYYDQKDEQDNYGYYTPDHLPAPIQKQYRTRMDQIFDVYSDMVHKLTAYVATQSSTPQAERDIAWKDAVRAQACDAVRSVLPVAAKSTVGIFASGQALESLIIHLLSDELPQARQTGADMLAEARKIVPAFFEHTARPDRGGAAIAYRSDTHKAVQRLAQQYVSGVHASSDVEPVQLTAVWPRNELDLIPDMLYEHTSLPLDELQKEVIAWPYAKKMEVFEAYIGERLSPRHKPGRALEKAHYSWDLVCDYGTFRELQRHRMVDDLQWQQLTPRYGYDVPKLVEEAGLVEQFEECFDLSLKLYSLLQEMGYPLEAQYATLLGHKLRWKITYNAREAFHLHELRTGSHTHPNVRKIIQQMHDKLTQTHPTLGEAMKFVNQEENPSSHAWLPNTIHSLNSKQLEQSDNS